jgi:hypothetical protein
VTKYQQALQDNNLNHMAANRMQQLASMSNDHFEAAVATAEKRPCSQRCGRRYGSATISAMLRPLSLVLPTAILCLALPVAAWADDRAACAAGDGTLLTGVVVAQPAYAPGKPLQGIPLSHTHIRIRGDQDGKTYDIAVDDVFASGYDPQVETVPAPLNAIQPGQHLEACGIPYAGGMHWVHTNCGATPTPKDPNGWLKVLDATGTAGPNLEDSQKYCSLWPARAVRRHRRR